MSKRNCDEECIHTQEKFRCLIEQRKKARKEWTVKKPTSYQQRKDVLQFIEDNQSFCGVIHEAACDQQHCEESNISGAVSSVMVEGCVTLLKSQAAQSSSPLDLLAAETLADRLLSLNNHTENLATETRSQLLTSQDKGVMLSVLKIIKCLLSEHSFNRVHFAKCLTVKGHVLPIEVVWTLHSECIISLNTYFACCLQDNLATSKLASSLENICHYSDTATKQTQEKMLSGVLSTLLPLAHPENRTAAGVKKPSGRTLEKVSQDVLWLLTKDKETDSLVQRGTHSSKILQVLEVIRMLSCVPNAVVNRFFTSYLSKLLSSTPVVSVYEAVSSQKRWIYSSQSTETRCNYEQILCVFKPAVVMEFIRNAVEKQEVNWHKVLSFLSVFVVCVTEAAGVIEAYVSELVANALAECDNHRLCAAFLIERQAALEGAHVFQPYVTWFESTFGEVTHIAALSTKKSVQFFMKFLADLVPYEPAEYLKIHVIKTPSVSSKLRSHVTDYVALARTRLADLKEPVELGGMFSDSSESGAESKTEHTKQEEQAARDVGKVLETFEKSGRVPSSVMEASIFRKPYFIGRFVPALLIPRKLPDVPDARIQLIETLKKAGKIPNGMMASYSSACERLALEHIEASSSSDESALSNMEKLVKTLRQLTVAVLAELDKEKPSRTPSVKATLSVVSTNIKAAMSRCSTQCIVGDFPAILDLQAPGLHEKDVQVCDAVLNSFCKTYAAVSGMDLTNTSERKKHQWTQGFLAMISSLPDLHVTLSYRLWCLLVNQGSMLQEHHIYGLACFLCCIAAYHSLMKQILFTGLGNGFQSNESNLFENKVAVAEFLCQNIPNHSGKEMMFSLRFYCAIIQHAFTSSGNVTTELSSKGAVSDSLCYVPPTAVKKLWYLFNRLRRSQHEQLQMHHNLAEALQDAGHVLQTNVFRKLREESVCQVSFREWLLWELSVKPFDDLLNKNERQEYLWSTVHDHFIPQEVSRGGCGGSYVSACTVIFNSLMDCDISRKSQSHQPCLDLERSIGNKEDVIKLLQELVLLLPGLASRRKSLQADIVPDQWLLNTFFTRLDKIEEENKDRKLNHSSEAFSLSREIGEFLRLMMLLPPHLLFNNVAGFSAEPKNIEKMVTFVNNYLRTYQSELCCLPLNVTSHLLKGLLSSVVGPGREQSPQDEVKENKVKKFLTDCPLFFISLQYHWKHLIPIASTMVGPTIMGGTARLHNWVASLFNSRQPLPSFGEVCELHPYMVGCSLYLALTQRHYEEFSSEKTSFLVERVVAVFKQELDIMEAFATNVCTSLFDCVIARFAELHLHGKEVKENTAFLDLVSKLCAVCPSVLNIFCRGKGSFGEERKSFNLRHLVLDEKLVKLYPLAFFSIFMEVSSTVPEKLLHTKGFIRVMLEMHLELAELRKNCLAETTSSDVVNKPFDIDFDCQVSSFVRRCIQRSPLEVLRALPEELVETACPNLCNLLRSRRAGGYCTAQR